jgi:hypothetical protein
VPSQKSKPTPQSKVIELLEEGEIQGWEEDVPQITLEELPEEDA